MKFKLYLSFEIFFLKKKKGRQEQFSIPEEKGVAGTREKVRSIPLVRYSRHLSGL